MSTIQRRIAFDIVVIFFISLIVITVLVMFIGVAREAVQQGLGVAGVLRLIPFALPNALSLAVPGTALFSVCCVYGRMSADNEFVAMQSVGISLLPSVMPAILITTALSLATVGLVNVAFTWGFNGIERVVITSIETIAYGVLERERSFQHSELSMTVREVQGHDLIEPQIRIHRSGSEPIVIQAKTAQLTYEDSLQSLQLRVTNGSATVGQSTSFHFPDTFVQMIPLAVEPDQDLLTAHPSHMPMRDLPVAAIRQADDIRTSESEMAVWVGFNTLASRPEQNYNTDGNERIEKIRQSHKRIHRLDTEMHRRWASGFTCLAMAMIGVPLAIRMKASDTMTTFGIVFLPTVLVYYPIFALTLDMAKDGRLMAAGVWSANAIFIAASLLMLRQLIYRPN